MSIELESTYGFALLIVAVVAWLFALFLMYQATAIHKWMTKDEENAPNSSAGNDMGLFLSFIVMFLYGFQFAIINGLRDDNIIRAIFMIPQYFIPAPLIAGIFPAAVATYKFSAMVMFSSEASHGKRPIAGAVIAIIHVLASVATLIMFRSYIFDVG